MAAPGLKNGIRRQVGVKRIEIGDSRNRKWPAREPTPKRLQTELIKMEYQV